MSRQRLCHHEISLSCWHTTPTRLPNTIRKHCGFPQPNPTPRLIVLLPEAHRTLTLSSPNLQAVDSTCEAAKSCSLTSSYSDTVHCGQTRARGEFVCSPGTIPNLDTRKTQPDV